MTDGDYFRILGGYSEEDHYKTAGTHGSCGVKIEYRDIRCETCIRQACECKPDPGLAYCGKWFEK